MRSEEMALFLTIRPSPVIALNRAIAVAESEGLSAASKNDVAREHFTAVLTLGRNPMERRLLARHLEVCVPVA